MIPLFNLILVGVAIVLGLFLDDGGEGLGILGFKQLGLGSHEGILVAIVVQWVLMKDGTQSTLPHLLRVGPTKLPSLLACISFTPPNVQLLMTIIYLDSIVVGKGETVFVKCELMVVWGIAIAGDLLAA